MLRITLGKHAGAITLLVALVTVAHPGAAQEALVLSGGGSRGLAHAGVFEGLEQLGHDPEIVVGTSMGAMIGALYAAGYEPEAILRALQAAEWGEIFTPIPLLLGPDRAVRYPALTADISVDSLRFSRGFIPQWRINRLLVRLLFEANARIRGDFDRLPRRYRAVAADLGTGEMVVLGRGDLARAARASIAVPGVFAPVLWDDRVLVDGGVANNLPVSVARELGAERVVAVDVSSPPPEIEASTPVGVASRALGLLLVNALPDGAPPEELVRPRIDPDFMSTTFPADPTPLFRLGLAATLRDLKPALGGDRPEPLPLPPEPDAFARLVVEAPSPAIDALARHVFAGVAPGPYDPEEVLKAVDRLYATGLFQGVWPRVAEAPDSGSAPVLALRLEAPPSTSVAAAVGYGNDRGARIWAAFRKGTSLGNRPAELMISASYNGLERWGAASARLHSLRFAPLAWSAGAHYRGTEVRRFEAELEGTDFEVRRTGGWLGLDLPRVDPARVMTALLRAERVDVEGGESGWSYGPLLRFAALEPGIAVVGVPLNIEAELRGGDFGYSRAEARGSITRAAGGFLLAGVADVALTSEGAPIDVQPALGDERWIPGLLWGEERAQGRIVAGLDLAYPIFAGFARARLRAGAGLDTFGTGSESNVWLAGVEIGALWTTPVGSVVAGVGASSRGDRRLVVNFGPQF
jgi:predicted acylesterase/phospholipase RssA